MWDTQLEKAILQEARLVGADLSRAHCAGAILWHADLTGANVIDADFSDVDLRQTIISRDQLVKVGSLRGAQYEGEQSLRLRLLRSLSPGRHKP